MVYLLEILLKAIDLVNGDTTVTAMPAAATPTTEVSASITTATVTAAVISAMKPAVATAVPATAITTAATKANSSSKRQWQQHLQRYQK